MEGEYEVRRVMCQGCESIHLATDGHPRKAAETVWVVDGSPDGYEPDPRMFPKFDSATSGSEVLPDPVGEGAHSADPEH